MNTKEKTLMIGIEINMVIAEIMIFLNEGKNPTKDNKKEYEKLIDKYTKRIIAITEDKPLPGHSDVMARAIQQMNQRPMTPPQ